MIRIDKNPWTCKKPTKSVRFGFLIFYLYPSNSSFCEYWAVALVCYWPAKPQNTCQQLQYLTLWAKNKKPKSTKKVTKPVNLASSSIAVSLHVHSCIRLPTTSRSIFNPTHYHATYTDPLLPLFSFLLNSPMFFYLCGVKIFKNTDLKIFSMKGL